VDRAGSQKRDTKTICTALLQILDLRLRERLAELCPCPRVGCFPVPDAVQTAEPKGIRVRMDSFCDPSRVTKTGHENKTACSKRTPASQSWCWGGFRTAESRLGHRFQYWIPCCRAWIKNGPFEWTVSLTRAGAP